VRALLAELLAPPPGDAGAAEAAPDATFQAWLLAGGAAGVMRQLPALRAAFLGLAPLEPSPGDLTLAQAPAVSLPGAALPHRSIVCSSAQASTASSDSPAAGLDSRPPAATRQLLGLPAGMPPTVAECPPASPSDSAAAGQCAPGNACAEAATETAAVLQTEAAPEQLGPRDARACLAHAAACLAWLRARAPASADAALNGARLGAAAAGRPACHNEPGDPGAVGPATAVPAAPGVTPEPAAPPCGDASGTGGHAAVPGLPLAAGPAPGPDAQDGAGDALPAGSAQPTRPGAARACAAAACQGDGPDPDTTFTEFVEAVARCAVRACWPDILQAWPFDCVCSALLPKGQAAPHGL
jgi:hypothetical protein